MVPASRLVAADNVASARVLFERYADYCVIPICLSNRITHYLTRELSEEVPIQLHRDVVGDGTSIIDLVEYLQHSEFVFVLVGGTIGGFIHFSDLNHRLVELTFYLMLQAVENHFAPKIAPEVTEDKLPRLLDEKRAQYIINNYRRIQRRQANRDLMNLLTLHDILTVACNHNLLTLNPAALEEFNCVRNSVSHAWEPLIEKHEDVGRLVRVRDHCLAIPREVTVTRSKGRDFISSPPFGHQYLFSSKQQTIFGKQLSKCCYHSLQNIWFAGEVYLDPEGREIAHQMDKFLTAPR